MSQPTNWGVPRTDGGNEYTPEQFAERTDDSFDALLTLHKGNSRPAYAEAGTLWLDDSSTPWVMKLFDGSDDITIGTINPSSNVFSIQPGQASAVSYESQSLNSGQQAQARANIGLGNSATRNVGTTAGTVAAGDDSRINSAMRSKGVLGQTDLNTIGAYGDYGVYHQTANADATPQRNYPVQNAGTLIVTPAAYGCMQMYLPYNQPKIFVRGLTGTWNGSGPWGGWGEIGGNAVPTSRTITAGTGLTGGGDLSANRTLSVDSTVWRDGNRPSAAQIGAAYAAVGFNQVGSLAWAYSVTSGSINAGSTYAGSNLRTSGFHESSTGSVGMYTTGAQTLSGTWRALGTSAATTVNNRATLFMRIS